MAIIPHYRDPAACAKRVHGDPRVRRFQDAHVFAVSLPHKSNWWAVLGFVFYCLSQIDGDFICNASCVLYVSRAFDFTYRWESQELCVILIIETPLDLKATKLLDQNCAILKGHMNSTCEPSMPMAMLHLGLLRRADPFTLGMLTSAGILRGRNVLNSLSIVRRL